METQEKLYDLSKLEKLCDGDKKFMDKMIQVFIKDTPSQIEKIKTGFELKDAEMVRFAAHRLKPAMQNICSKIMIDEVIFLEKETENGNLNEQVFEVSKRLEIHSNEIIKQLLQRD